jgi:threonine aldolase
VPSPDGSIDLRSDTVTTPTPEMRRAMAEAVVGDDEYGEDPTVNELEALAAEMLGKERALYVPSGTMANQLALRILGRPGTDVICGARAHVYQYEHAATARNASVQLRPLPDTNGILEPGSLANAIADSRHHLPSISAVTVENTHMPAGGRPWKVEQLDALVKATQGHDVGLHCDGARIWNASVALGVPGRDLVLGFDTVMFCVSKGLSAPVGSLLCGSHDLIVQARVERARLGGGMRQAGVIAAAGLVALRTMVDRLAEDHSRAKRLAAALADLFPGSVEPDDVETNIVCTSAAHLPEKIIERLDDSGVRCGTIDARTVRFVTHKDVDDADLDRVITALSAMRE